MRLGSSLDLNLLPRVSTTSRVRHGAIAGFEYHWSLTVTGFTNGGSQARNLKIAKIFVYKHSFCYLNVENVKQKNSLFYQPIVLWLAF